MRIGSPSWCLTGLMRVVWALGVECAKFFRAISMKTTFLDFEQPIAELEAKIEELRFVQDDSAVDISEEIARLEQKNFGLTKDIYAKLTPWQCALVARHPQRPYTLDYAPPWARRRRALATQVGRRTKSSAVAVLMKRRCRRSPISW